MSRQHNEETERQGGKREGKNHVEEEGGKLDESQVYSKHISVHFSDNFVPSAWIYWVQSLVCNNCYVSCFKTSFIEMMNEYRYTNKQRDGKQPQRDFQWPPSDRIWLQGDLKQPQRDRKQLLNDLKQK